jgi:two-component system, LytTR family, sensor histidine kinase AlgZ
MHPILQSRTRLLLYALAWLIAGVLLADLLHVTAAVPWGEAAALGPALGLIYGCVCLGAFYVCRAAPLTRTSGAEVVATQLAAAGVSASLWLGAARAGVSFLNRPELLPGLAERTTGIGPILLAAGVLLFLLTSAVHYVVFAVEKSLQAETQSLQYQVLSREAELKALRAQLHPHFLFNSLNSVVALIKRDPEAARRTCVMLADFLRDSLTFGAKEGIPLSEELALAEKLLTIEKVRFGSRLVYESRVEEAARTCPVPPLLLQPLVENAVTHGIAHLLDGGTIVVEASRRAGRLELAVENPRDPDARISKGTGLGLDNVRRRLAAVYGREATMQVRSEPSRFRVELSLPDGPAAPP